MLEIPVEAAETTITVDDFLEENIHRQVSPHDQAFEIGRELFGDEYVEAYIDRISSHLAETIVQAYAAHDRKQYRAVGNHFAEVYNFLFPVDARAAQDAGDGHAYALVHHDVIEDGVETVQEHYDVEQYEDIRHEWEEYTTKQIDNNSGWNQVLLGFMIVDDALDFPKTCEYQDKTYQPQLFPFEDVDGETELLEVDPFAWHRNQFILYHTAAKEAQDRGSDRNKRAHSLMERYVKDAENIFLSALIDDEALIDELGDTYIEAVAEHDRHDEEELENNTARMTGYYERILREVIDT